MPNLMIIDDHALFREGLRNIMERDSRYTVVAEAGSTTEGISLALEHKPDVMLVDIAMNDNETAGIKLMRTLRKKLPTTKFLVVSMHTEPDYISEALSAGASGYVTKESAANKLLDGIATVLNGKRYVDDVLSSQTIEMLMDNEMQSYGQAYDSLTKREQEVLRLLSEGLNSREVANKLYITPKTVENHRGNLMKKLNLSNSVEMVRFAAKIGLIQL